MSTPLNRRDFLKVAGLGAAGWHLSAAMSRSAFAAKLYGRRPNIVWIMAEDIAPDLACYGTPEVKTPNLDRMAAEGIRYTNAFATCPVCSPSRSAMITGMYQTTIGAHNHRSHRDDGYMLPAPVRLITDYLRDVGYFIANNGKTDFNFNTERPPADGKDWRQRKDGEPFFAQITLAVSHRNFTRDKQNPIDPAKVVIPPYYPDHPITRRDWADYLESIQLMDRQVGGILERLKTEGLADNTVVFFIGDNGRCHVRGKQWLYNPGIHVPLIIRWPGTIKGGQVCTDMVSTIDISATILKLAGIEPPGHIEGRVFLGPDAKKRQYIAAASFARQQSTASAASVRRSSNTSATSYPSGHRTQFVPTRPASTPSSAAGSPAETGKLRPPRPGGWPRDPPKNSDLAKDRTNSTASLTTRSTAPSSNSVPCWANGSSKPATRARSPNPQASSTAS